MGTNSIAITNNGEKILISFSETDDPFILSKDAGITWEEIPTPEKENTDWPLYTQVFSNSGSRIVAMERSYSVWTSDDFGQTWVKRLAGEGAE